MIKANELRVGSILQLDSENEVIVRVESFFLNDGVWFIEWIKILGKGLVEGCDVIQEFEYIPLTVEWLERFGLSPKQLEPDDLPQWTSLNMNIAQYTDGFYLYTITSDPWHDQAVGKKIEYVHTLQNISLDLFGEELNVKL